VHADPRPPRVVGALVDLQHLLHLADEGGILLGRDAPHRLSPRLQGAFFKARRTVSWQMASTTSSSTSRSAKRRKVQRAYPRAGCEQASAVKRACCSPSSFAAIKGGPLTAGRPCKPRHGRPP